MAADEINLPDLVSHLGVDLTGLSGTVADAARQGSSVGAALGGGIQRELRDLVANLPSIDVDASTDEVDRDLARVRQQLDDLADQRIGVDVSITDALRSLEELEPHLQRLSDTHPNIDVQASTRQALRQLEELRAAARQADDADVRIDVDVDEERPRRLTDLLSRIPAIAGRAAGALSGVGVAAAGIGTAVPVVAGLAATLANVAPAAGLAVTGMAAMQLASGTLKLAMVGVEDAISAALDPSKAAEFEEALEKLSPSARAFATEVRDLSPALREMQQAVQEEAFRGLADNLERTAKSVLPVLRTNLLDTATALGDMAAGAMGAAGELAEDGTLGRALGSASAGLQNLAGVPGVVVTALGQIAAAAGPSFEKLTAGAADAAFEIGERLGDAFESGRMEQAIEDAIDLIGDLVDVAGNIGSIFGSVFEAAQVSGGGLVGTLKEITGALADAFASPEVQGGLRALFETMATLAREAAPLLAQALAVIGPILEELGPPAQELIEALGEGLAPIIDELGPVLLAAASAVGALVEAASPLLPVIGELIAGLLPVLTPLLEACEEVFRALAPVVGDVALILQDTLAPILDELPGIIRPLADLLANNLTVWLTILGDLLVELGPSFVQLGESAGELLEAATPLIAMFADLVAKLAQDLMPLIRPLIGLIGDLAKIFTGTLAAAIHGVIVPALQILVALLRGDFSGAWQIAKNAVENARRFISEKAQSMATTVGQRVTDAISHLRGMPGRTSSALSSLPGVLGSKGREAGLQLVTSIGRRMDEAIGVVRSLPGRVRSALGGLDNLLYSSGRSLIAGFVAGILSMAGEVANAAASIVSEAADFFPHSPAKRGPFSGRGYTSFSGQALIRGFEEGILARLPQLTALLQQLPGLPDMQGPRFPAVPSAAALAGVTLPSAQQLRPVAAASGGDQYNTFHLHGSDASPDGIVRELSWLALAQGRR